MRLCRFMLPVILCFLFQPLPAMGAVQPHPVVAVQLKEASISLSPALLARIGEQVTVSGFYYGGSVPMIIDDIARTDYNMELPPGCFLPLEGSRPAGLKSGDRITISGVLAKPSPASRLAQTPAILRIERPDAIRIVSPVNAPKTKLAPKKPGILRSIEKYRPQDLEPGNRYAVLIAGGGKPESNYIRYWNDLLTMYNILLARGFDASGIFVFYADGAEPDPETEGKLDGTMPINGVASRTNIQRCFRDLGRISAGNDLVFILANDHGGGFLEVRSGPFEPGLSGGRVTTTGEINDAISESQYSLDLNGDGDTNDVVRVDESLSMWGGRYYDDDFAADLNQITRYGTMVIHLEQCFSGGFLEDLRGPDRIVFSAASEQRPSRAHSPSPSNPQTVQQYNEIFYWFVTALLGETPDGDYALDRNGNPWTPNADYDGNGKISVFEAFMFARRMNLKDGMPWYEDNNQQGHISVNVDTTNVPEGSDGWLGSRTFP